VSDKTFLKVGFPFGISHFIVNIVLHNLILVGQQKSIIAIDTMKKFKTYNHLVTMLFSTMSIVSRLRKLSTVFLAFERRINHLNLFKFLEDT
jgi:hypothetical protein